VRPVGSYTVSPADGEPHQEGAGDGGGVVCYSVRAGERDTMFEVLDADFGVVGTLGLEDFAALLAKQRAG
jgi:hypothetical protein